MIARRPRTDGALDADGLRQIVDNLLGNALKFTDAGGIEVRLQPSPIPSARELLLDVIDSGIGIAPAHRRYCSARSSREDGRSAAALAWA